MSFRRLRDNEDIETKENNLGVWMRGSLDDQEFPCVTAFFDESGHSASLGFWLGNCGMRSTTQRSSPRGYEGGGVPLRLVMTVFVASSQSVRNIGWCADVRRHERLNRSGIPGPNQTLKRNPQDENTVVSQPASGDRVGMIQFRRVSSSVQTVMMTATSFGKGLSREGTFATPLDALPNL